MADLTPDLPKLESGLVHFGLDAFRPGQADVIQAVLHGRNAVVVMPTGAGKSLCYQLPAVLLKGVTVVVSPLISLMKDQVEQLDERGIPATFINSTQSDLERAERLRKLKAGQYKLVYVAPERFRSASFVEALLDIGVDLFAVDEAHCISQWGHDFRPDYAMLGQVRKRLRPPRTVALTATATPEVQQDIVKSLLLKDPQVFVAGFDRKNFFLEVVPVAGDEDRLEAAARALSGGGSGIVYCSTRKFAEAMERGLRQKGLKPVLYHAGMDDEARRKAQDAFMGSPDAIAVATNAFGMGIDKPDIRCVVHAQIPRAVEAYYQEIGRAGRDGQSAQAVLLFNHADVYTQERMIQGNHPSESVLADVWNALVSAEVFDRGVSALAGQVGASEFEVSAALRIFERHGKLARLGRDEGAYTVSAVNAAPDGLKPDDAKALFTWLSSQRGAVTGPLVTLAERSGLTVDRARRALQHLERAKHVTVRRPFAGKTLRPLHRLPFRELGLDLSSVREQERRALLLLKRMTDYAYTKRCRRSYLLRYFGDPDAQPSCHGCDVCQGAKQPRSATRPKLVERRVGPTSELAMLELRRWRKELARELEIAPFIIFNDKTLEALAQSLPIDRDSFLRVKGVGEARWERFGPKVVEICLMARATADGPA
jgi:ATP-dependent DNA helicase RecQ